MPVVMLHGLGQTPASWDAVARSLGNESVRPELFALLRGGEAVYENLYRAFSDDCARLPEPLHLCGLSLGGVLALQYSAEHSGRVGSLVLIGTPCAMPRGLLRVQGLVFRLMPERAFRQMGLSKKDVLALTSSMLDLDLRENLARVKCPALVLCGERDRANRQSALDLQAGLPRAGLAWVPGAGHEANLDAPEALAGILADFYRRIGAAL